MFAPGQETVLKPSKMLTQSISELESTFVFEYVSKYIAEKLTFAKSQLFG